MNILAEKLASMQKKGEKALVPFLMAGDPDLETTEELLQALVAGGADVIELGIPFSDPLADGPVLQAAAGRALQAETAPGEVIALAARFRKKQALPLVLLVYFNIILRYGQERFCHDAAAAGVSALVVPDLPYEEAAVLTAIACKAGIINISLIAPTTSEKRLRKICSTAAGFIYCVTVTGVTGERQALDVELPTLLQRARQYTDLPLLLGFGLFGPGQAALAAKLADGVIMGSALAQRLGSAVGVEGKYHAAKDFTRLLKKALRGGEQNDS
ncbi:MAG: tryptophan synthase subunit alpha [Dethiobacter sp.]|nr:tryptophan synthase subunit alpha [Dethiobacter sp.]MCL5982967.1 tryptophan synthase subunit alpha [Bacillota bacterium]